MGTAGQQIWSKIDSFQNAEFLVSRPNPVVLPLIGIVSKRRFQWGSQRGVRLGGERIIMKTVLVLSTLKNKCNRTAAVTHRFKVFCDIWELSAWFGAW